MTPQEAEKAILIFREHQAQFREWMGKEDRYTQRELNLMEWTFSVGRTMASPRGLLLLEVLVREMKCFFIGVLILRKVWTNRDVKNLMDRVEEIEKAFRPEVAALKDLMPDFNPELKEWQQVPWGFGFAHPDMPGTETSLNVISIQTEEINRLKQELANERNRNKQSLHP